MPLNYFALNLWINIILIYQCKLSKKWQDSLKNQKKAIEIKLKKHLNHNNNNNNNNNSHHHHNLNYNRQMMSNIINNLLPKYKRLWYY